MLCPISLWPIEIVLSLVETKRRVLLAPTMPDGRYCNPGRAFICLWQSTQDGIEMRSLYGFRDGWPTLL